jgi:hypothetical protein
MAHREPLTKEVFRYHVRENPSADSEDELKSLNSLVSRYLLTYDRENKTYWLHEVVKAYLEKKMYQKRNRKYTRKQLCITSITTSNSMWKSQ